jgi:UDP-2,3-diacylglucosamine hydrolase
MKKEEKFVGEEGEFLWVYCKEMEETNHHDFYIFGHRHLPLDLRIGESSRYVNLGEWVNFSTYAEYDGALYLKSFEPTA